MPTAAPTTASVTQWKSSDTMATPVASGPEHAQQPEGALHAAAGSPYSTACQRAIAPHEHGVGHVPGREGLRRRQWKK